jgi:beta-galactosidase/beta-glucuronidase
MKPVIYQKFPYSSEVDFSAYPRPQMVRDSYFCLNGEWSFAISKSFTPPEFFPLKIQVPFPVESTLSGISQTPEKGEILYYKRIFSLPENFKKARVLLHFGASDQVTTVYLNKKKIGTNEGGYHPFTLDITDTILESNEIVVSVIDDLSLR